MLSLGFLGLGKQDDDATRKPWRIAVPAFHLQTRDIPAAKPQCLSREEIIAAFSDVLSPMSAAAPGDGDPPAPPVRMREAA